MRTHVSCSHAYWVCAQINNYRHHLFSMCTQYVFLDYLAANFHRALRNWASVVQSPQSHCLSVFSRLYVEYSKLVAVSKPGPCIADWWCGGVLPVSGARLDWPAGPPYAVRPVWPSFPVPRLCCEGLLWLEMPIVSSFCLAICLWIYKCRQKKLKQTLTRLSRDPILRSQPILNLSCNLLSNTPGYHSISTKICKWMISFPLYLLSLPPHPSLSHHS